MDFIIPLTALGLYYVWRLGLSWRDVEASEEVRLGQGQVPGEPPRDFFMTDCGNAWMAGLRGSPHLSR